MKQTHSIPAAAALLAGGILLSRCLGYVREMLLAWKFGAGATTDAFYAAFQIPDLLNYFLAGGALSIAFIPLYNKVLTKDGEAAAHDMMAAVLGTLGAIAVAATAVLWLYAPQLIALQFPKFDAQTAALTVRLTRIVLPAQVFFITGGILQAVLLARKSFHAAALAPLVYNACIIAGGLLLYPYIGIRGFAVGTLVGAFAGPFLTPLLHARGHIPFRLAFAPRNRHFLVYIALAAPLMFGQTLLTLDEWYGRWFAALLPAGAVTHISYARRLMQAPVALIGQAVAAAALPTLSRLWAEGRAGEMNALLSRTLSTGLALSVLAAAAMFSVASPAVALLYRQGAFTDADAAAVAALACIYAFAVPAWITQQITARAFYARGDTWRPMALGTIISLAVIPIYMKFSSLGGVAGIAVAGAVAMSLNALATLILARRLHGAPSIKEYADAFIRSIAIAAAATAAAHGGLHLRESYIKISGLHPKIMAFLDLSIGGATFALVAVPGVFLLGHEDLRGYLLKVFSKIKAHA